MSRKKRIEAQSVEPAAPTITEKPPETAPRTKRAVLLELISGSGGATLEELTSATGWLPHTARAAITGLRKRGHDVQRERVDGVSRYIIESGGR